MKLNRFLALLAVVLLVGTSAFAQTSSSLTGRVTMDGNPLPGVTVTISSPQMQGTRIAITDVNGNYNLAALPPGLYTVKFEMESMQSVTRTAHVGLGETGRADAVMRLSTMAEAITVTAAAPAVLETTQVAANIDKQMVDDLPIQRTLQGIVSLQPGVVASSGTGNAISISGAPAYDSLYLVNGAVTNEGLRGQTHNLFIEDAIQETTVMTGAISAEYGRFTGGVVSAITKSGGNEFSGSVRDSLTNNSWVSQTPAGEAKAPSDLQQVYEGTLGGRILRDRLWFFAAGRDSNAKVRNFLLESDIPFDTGQKQRRWEGKLTGHIAKAHTLTLSYLDIKNNNTMFDPFGSYEMQSLDVSRDLPNSFATAQYNGIITNNFLLEANYSKKKFAFVGSGGDFSDFARGTWVSDAADGGYFGAPIFCGFCTPETRDNKDFSVKGTYYLASKAFGTHSLVAGYDNFIETRLSNNHQSGSDFGFINFQSVIGLRDSEGFIRPDIEPGDLILWNPILQDSLGSKLKTTSLFVNDRWDLSRQWSFNLGARYDKNDAKDSAGHPTANDSGISPRLGATFDTFSDGRLRLNASYSKYVSKIQETIGGSGASPAGNPAYVYYEYGGPAITGLRTVDALQQVYNWFQAQGGTKASDLIVGAKFPGFDIQIPHSLTSPSVNEWTLGAGTRIGASGFLRADYIRRDWKNFYVQRIDQSTGKFTDPLGLGISTDMAYLENDNGNLKRNYNALSLQAEARPFNRLNVGANYTYSKSKGNVNGETGPNGPVADGGLTYPEFKAFAQNNPSGPLLNDQTHKARGWVDYDLPTPVGRFNFSILERFDSGSPYSALGTIDARQSAAGTACASCPSPAALGYLSSGRVTGAVNYYFGGRGAYRWDNVTATDLGINYELAIVRAAFFVQGDIVNVFNESAQVNGNTTVLTHKNGPYARFNPFTDKPVAGVNYALGSTFGKARNATDYQTPRTYRVSLGLRF